MKSKRLSLVFAVFFALLSGCASLPSKLLEIPENRIPASASIGVVWISPCSQSKGCRDSGAGSTLGEFVPAGASGLLSYGIAISAHEELILALDSVSANTALVNQFVQPVSHALTEKGFQVTPNETNIYAGDLEKLGRHKTISLASLLEELHPREDRLVSVEVEHQWNMTEIASDLGVDYLAVMELKRFTIQRDFGPLAIPITQPYAYSVVRAYLIELASGEILFNDYGLAEVQLEGEWRQPDDWTNAHAGINASLNLAVDRATETLLTAIQSFPLE